MAMKVPVRPTPALSAHNVDEQTEEGGEKD